MPRMPDPKPLTASTDARWLARAGANPDCGAGRLPINYDRLFAGTSYSLDPGQSPAAFATGNIFERVCEGPTGSWAPLRNALAEAGIDLGAGGNEVIPDHLPDQVRAKRTRELLDRMLSGDRTVVLLSQATLAFEFAGGAVMIRPDAVAIIPADDQLMVTELKGFRMRDGHFPSRKIAGALGQSAVYQSALRRIAADLGYDPAVISDDVVIVCARNTGMNPIASRHNNGDRRRTQDLRIARAETKLLAAGGMAAAQAAVAGLTTTSPGPDRVDAFRDIAATHGTAYRPSCLSGCGAARWCREAAADQPIRLGTTRLLAPAGTFRQAERFSYGETTADPDVAAVAARLAEVRALLDEARADAGLPAPPPPPARRRRPSRQVAS